MKFPALGALTLNKLGSVAGRLSKVYKIIDTQSFAFAFELKSKWGDIITLSRRRVEYKNMFHITHVLPWVKPQCIIRTPTVRDSAASVTAKPTIHHFIISF